MTTSIT